MCPVNCKVNQIRSDIIGLSSYVYAVFIGLCLDDYLDLISPDKTNRFHRLVEQHRCYRCFEGRLLFSL